MITSEFPTTLITTTVNVNKTHKFINQLTTVDSTTSYIIIGQNIVKQKIVSLNVLISFMTFNEETIKTLNILHSQNVIGVCSQIDASHLADWIALQFRNISNVAVSEEGAEHVNPE